MPTPMPTPGIEEFRSQSYSAALPLLTASARGGNAEAQCLLGNLYQLGLGNTAANPSKALRWYYRAAKQGYSEATSHLAGMIWPISREAAAALNQLAQQQAIAQATTIRKTAVRETAIQITAVG